MPRLDCLNGTQRLLIEDALTHFSNIEEMAKKIAVHPRTVRDWRREKYRMPLEALRRICSDSGLPLPISLKILPDLWHVKRAAQMGGRRRFQLYGPLGSLESRRRGGMASVEKFQNDPLADHLGGFQIAKPIQYPTRSALLAELVGILLGDGCLGNEYQVSVSFNSETDVAHAHYMRRLFKTLFGLHASIWYRKQTRTGIVTASSRLLHKYLIDDVGLQKGNKVVEQVDLPDWIWGSQVYQTACLRGLVDTDGSVYSYEHRVNGHSYRHKALCFTNHSMPLLRSVERLLRNLGLHPKIYRYNVYLHQADEIRGYFNRVGTSNPKHLRKYRMSWRGPQVVDGAALEKR